MYESFYGLREKPFSILPDPDLIYWGQNHRFAFAMLEFGVMNSAGFTVVTGEVGCGKTTLVRYLLRRLDHHVTACVISNTPRPQDGFLPWVMMSLDLPFEGSYPTLFKQFNKYLLDQAAGGRRTILIVDEAQNLAMDALEELRMLSNVNTDKQQFLQVILVGQPQLRDTLRAPQLLQFAQRISSDFHLKPMNTDEVTEYINFRLQAVGSSEQLFADEACKIIGEITRGVPRTINVLCDTALVYGYAAQAKVITAEIVNSVIKNKEQFGVVPFGLEPA
jgi:type II secretory pathway predicted ATPase ExeA